MSIPFDPDFDAPAPSAASGGQSFFNALTARQALLLGVGVAVGGLATLGFVFLLLFLL